MTQATQTQAIERRTEAAKLAAVEQGGFGRNSIVKLNMRELKELAEVFIQSGSFNDVKETAQAMVKIIAGQELGFSPIVSMTGIHFFNGKVSLGANLIASLIKDNGKYEYKITEHSNAACSVVFYQNINGELKQLGVPVRYTIEDAKNAGLTGKDNWKKYPADMLFAACIRQGARRYCADILRGVTPETDTEHDDSVDRTAMDGAEIVPAAGADTEVIDGEIVDTATGEVVEAAADGQPAGELPFDETADTLRQFHELMIVKFGDGEQVTDEDGAAAFLKGHDPAVMPLAALQKLLGELKAI